MAGKKAVVFSVIIVFLVVVGIINIILNVEENKCEMTWMFEQPQYLVRRLKTVCKEIIMPVCFGLLNGPLWLLPRLFLYIFFFRLYWNNVWVLNNLDQLYYLRFTLIISHESRDLSFWDLVPILYIYFIKMWTHLITCHFKLSTFRVRDPTLEANIDPVQNSTIFTYSSTNFLTNWDLVHLLKHN